MTPERDYIEIGFQYTDQFGNETKVEKKLARETMSGNDLNALLDNFKYFLINAGYTFMADKEIDIIDEDE